jgi:uncharacterized protein
MSALPASPIGPVESSERVQLLDALRGLAILGIFVANIIVFCGWWFMDAAQQEAVPLAAWNQWGHFLETVFVQGKFYSLFSLLFGIGLAVQLTRGRDRGTDVARLYRRRLRILLGIGLIHLVLVWAGDILTLYALLGFVLVLFRRQSDRTLLAWAAVLLVAPVIQHALALVTGGATDASHLLFAAGAAVDGALGFDESATLVSVYGAGGWREVLFANLAGPFYRFGEIVQEGRAFKVLALFLVGLLVGRRMLYRPIEEHGVLLKRILVWGLAIGLPACIVLALIEHNFHPEYLTAMSLLASAAYAVGVAPMALAYAAGIALVWQRKRGQAWLLTLAPVGRTALSNYLLQTLIGIGLFYGIGLGLMGAIGPGPAMLMAVGIFAGQVVLSTWWLQHFRFGPVEWVWRSLTYRRRQPMRLRAALPPAEPAI